MDADDPFASSDVPSPRDSLSRANAFAARMQCLLADPHPSWDSGRFLGLRAYAILLSANIADLVMKSETADASEFDTYVEIVAVMVDDLEAVLYELLKA